MKGVNDLWMGDRRLSLSEAPFIVGILNVTPDSFSDGGDFSSIEAAVGRARRMADEGSLIIDVGGESTRPDAVLVSVDEELERVVPVVEAIARMVPEALISIDTSKSQVAREALKAGACIVNDVTGFFGDDRMAAVVAEAKAACVLMYNSRMDSSDDDILKRVQKRWRQSVSRAVDAGVDKRSIILDPGIGFGTTREEDLRLLAFLGQLKKGGFPVLLGASRKRVTGDLLDLAVNQRLETTLATTVVGVESGVEFFRVHDVLENARSARMAKLIYDKRNG